MLIRDKKDDDIQSFALLSEKARGQVAAEAISWWNLKGRHLIPKTLNTVADGELKVTAGSGAPAIVVKPGTKMDLPGILAGVTWDCLDDVDRIEVVKQYFRHHWLPRRAQSPAGSA